MGFFFSLGVAETAIRPGREGEDDDPYEVERGGGSVCVGGYLMWSLCVGVLHVCYMRYHHEALMKVS